MFILLFAMWLVLNGKVTPEIVCIGLVLSAAVYIMCCVLLGYNVRRDLDFFRALPYFAAWFILLIWEIMKANWTMIRIILNPSIPVRQTLVTFNSGLLSDVGRALLADSITLTPGTITVDAGRDGIFVVHCLSDSMLEGIEDSRLMRVIRKVEAIYG